MACAGASVSKCQNVNGAKCRSFKCYGNAKLSCIFIRSATRQCIHRSAFHRIFRAHFQCRAHWPNMDLIHFFPSSNRYLSWGQHIFSKVQRFQCVWGLRQNGREKCAERKSDSIIIFAVSIRQLRLAHVFRAGCQHGCTHVCAVTMNNRLVSIDGQKKLWAKYVLDVTSHGGSIDKANHVLIVDQI